MSDLLTAERRRLELLERALVELRQATTAVIRDGLDGNRTMMERRVGMLQACLTVMSECGDVDPACVLEHARGFYGVLVEQAVRHKLVLRQDTTS